MDSSSLKSEQPRENQARKKHYIPVKSRYLEFTKKFSSQSDNSGSLSGLKATNQHASSETHKPRTFHSVANSTLIGNGNRALGANISTVYVPKPERASKTSTPTKDVSLFAADLSVVPVGAECESHKHKHEDPAKLAEEVFEQYNTALLLEALGMLVDEQQAKCAQLADRELAALQKAVEESSCTLSALDVKINVATSLAELREDLDICEDVFAELVGDPAFSDFNGFKYVTSEIESMLNQLPCKNVKIPSSQKDIDEIQSAAAKLSNELSRVSLNHGEEIGRVCTVKREMSQIDTLCDNLAEAHSSAKELMPIATTKVLDEISTNMMNAPLTNVDIKF